MDSYIVTTDHINIGSQNQEDQVNLDGVVIGISIENLNASSDDLMYGINEAPKVLMQAGDPARQYGGFKACDAPCSYNGYIAWKFNSNTKPSGLIIITRLTTQTQTVE